MCATYIPPIESPYFNDDSFSILDGENNHFQAKGHVLFCGDLNARTGQEPDTLSTQGDKHLPGGDSIPSQICPPRHNYDKTTKKMCHNSCSLGARWVCTQSMLGFEEIPMVGTPTAHPLAADKIINNINHRSHCLFTPLSSRRRGQYRCIKAGTERQKLFFNLKAIRLLNSHHQHFRGGCLQTQIRNHWPLLEMDLQPL